MVSSLSSSFLVVDFHSHSLRFSLFFSCVFWRMCAELVVWSFGHLYSELYGFFLAYALCMCLFSLCGVSYLLTSGCAFGSLDMCFLVSWLLCSSNDYFIYDLFLAFCIGTRSHSFVFGGLFCLRFIFVSFLTSACSIQSFYGKMR